MIAVTQVIIGTAGHIDHGKTALIKALTGQDTDRLKEEKERGISIDLGFAYLSLPSGMRVGIIDVPGHERFIHNMLAGAHGIDLALFVVAADDGVMPQSEEHFDLLHLLGVRRGIFVITKADLVPAARLGEVEEEIRILAESTVLAEAPVIAVSAISGQGIEDLRQEIARQLADFQARRATGLFRLPVDRAFVMKGHGTIVTGTALGGSVHNGQKLRLLPGGGEVRVRSIQVHSQPVEEGQPGQRVALNLVAPEKLEISRGAVLADERLDVQSDRLDVRLEVRPAAKRALANNTHIRLFIATAQALGRVIVLEAEEEIAIKSSGLAQLVLQTPVVALAGDRFVIRDETSQRTLGGGVVLNPLGRRTRRPRELYRQRLQLLEGPPDAAALEAFLNLQDSFATAAHRVGILLNRRPDELAPALTDPRLIRLTLGEEEVYTTSEKWKELKRLSLAAVREHHQANPLSPGLEMELLRAQLPFDISARVFRTVIDKLGTESELVRDDSALRLKSHQIRLAGEDAQLADRIGTVLKDAGLQPPEIRQLSHYTGLTDQRMRPLLTALERQGRIVRLSPEHYIESTQLEQARQKLLQVLGRQSGIAAGAFRDLVGVSRKLAITLLEYFDRSGLTVRVGDERRLRQPQASIQK